MASKSPLGTINPRIVFVEVHGERVRPREAFWIVRNPAGHTVGFFPSDSHMQDDVATAARNHWKDQSVALRALNSGYYLDLVGPKKFVEIISKGVIEDTTPADLRDGKRA